MSTACGRPQGEGSSSRGRHKWMTPNSDLELQPTETRSMLPLIFLSQCAYKISFMQHHTLLISISNDTYEICKKTSWRKNFCALQVSLCTLVSRPLCLRTRLIHTLEPREKHQIFRHFYWNF